MLKEIMALFQKKGSDEWHYARGHTKLIRPQHFDSTEPIYAGWLDVPGAETYVVGRTDWKDWKPGEPFHHGKWMIKMWRWVDKDGSFVF